MYFEEAEHRHDCIASQVRRTILIPLFYMYMRQVEDILQVVPELPDKFLREFYGGPIAIRFVDGEMVDICSPCDTYEPVSDVGILVHPYRAKMSWSSA